VGQDLQVDRLPHKPSPSIRLGADFLARLALTRWLLQSKLAVFVECGMRRTELILPGPSGLQFRLPS